MNACLSKSTALPGRYNLIRRIRSRQVELYDSFQPCMEICNNIQSFARSLAPKELLVLNKIIYWFARFSSVYVTQSMLAKAAGCSRKHVNHVLSKFESLGIIKIGYRHLTSCVYHLSSFFKNPDVCFSLSKIITSFWTLGLMAACAGKEPEVTQLNYEYIYKKGERENKEILAVARPIQDNYFFTPKQEKLTSKLIWFKKGDKRMMGQEDQADMYVSLGYERE